MPTVLKDNSVSDHAQGTSSADAAIEAKPTAGAVCPVMPELAEEPSRLKRFVARFGALAFMFFLIKGLLWLVVPAVIAIWSMGGGGEQASDDASGAGAGQEIAIPAIVE